MNNTEDINKQRRAFITEPDIIKSRIRWTILDTFLLLATDGLWLVIKLLSKRYKDK